MSLAVEYYDTARRIFFASLALSGFNIVYAFTFMNRKSLSHAPRIEEVIQLKELSNARTSGERYGVDIVLLLCIFNA